MNKEQKQQERYFQVTRSQGIILLDYETGQDRLTLSRNTVKNEKTDEVYESFLSRIPETGAFSPESYFIFRNNLRHMMNGEAVDPFGLTLSFDGSPPGWYWMHLWALSNGDEKKLHIVGCGDDIMNALPEREAERAAQTMPALTDPVRIEVLTDPVLSTRYDLQTGNRIVHPEDRIPSSFPEDLDLPGFMDWILDRMDAGDLANSILHNRKKLSVEPFRKTGTHRQIDYHLQSMEGDETCKWYRFIYSGAVNDTDGHRILNVTVYDVDAQTNSQMDMIRMACTDPITGLPNRQSFERFCSSLLQDRSLAKTLNAVVLIDIDHAPEIRRKYNLSVMDSIMKKMAEQIRVMIPESDAAARFGDTLFLVTFHKLLNLVDLKNRLNVLQNSLKVPFEDGSVVTVSIGASLCHHDENLGYRCACELASVALENAKQLGGNRVILYSEELQQEKTQKSYQYLHAGKVPGKDVYIRMFGYFEVFVDGVPLEFHNQKPKELLALLADRRGGLLSSREAVSVLWEDEPSDKVTLARYRKVAMRLKNTLEQYGIEDIVRIVGRKRCLDVTKVHCDYYDYLTRKPEFATLFKGAYLLDYSWGENTAAQLVELSGHLETQKKTEA